MQEIEEDICEAEEGCREARLKGEKLGDQIPVEERYQEVLRRVKASKRELATQVLVLSILAVAVGVGLFFIYAWLIVIPIALWALLTFGFIWGCIVEQDYLFSSFDRDFPGHKERLIRDGLIKRPSKSDDATEIDD